MVMIDRLLECDQTTTASCFSISPDCLFLDNGELTSEGMIENIAQTCAARIGYLNMQSGNSVKLGFIGGIKDFRTSQRPVTGDTIVTRITVKEEIFGITLVDAVIMLNDTEIAHTTMKIALSDIDARR